MIKQSYIDDKFKIVDFPPQPNRDRDDKDDDRYHLLHSGKLQQRETTRRVQEASHPLPGP